MALLTFDAPGPGRWTLDTGHFPRPVTRFSAEVFSRPAIDGFRRSTEPYGLLLDFVEWAFVHGWGYSCPRPISTLAEIEGLDRKAWDRAVGSSVELSQRLAKSMKVFEHKPWRPEESTWAQRIKPAMIHTHRRLQAVDPSRLDASGMLAHLEACVRNLRVAIRVHHRFNVAPVVPVGDLLAHVEDWEAASEGQVLELLPRAGAEGGGGSRHLSALVKAVGDDGSARAVLFAEEVAADAVLAGLRSQAGPAGAAAADYLDLVGNWTAGAGTDVGEARLLELPEVLLETIRIAARRPQERGDDGREGASEIRRAVPAASRALFEELLAEARLVHGLRDERALYCDVWANGLTRRAILAAGERLSQQGSVEAPEHLLEAGYAETRALIESGTGPSAAELAERSLARQEAIVDDVPVVLGETSHRPVPIAWLPSGAARTERAFRTYLAAMSEGPEVDSADGQVVRGSAASAGVYEGRARVISDPGELHRLEEGDVLVAEATSPAFNVVLGLVGAVVTERGGLLSHAAIVAREFAIPAVVGCSDAMLHIPDGGRVRVDGGAGEATVLSPRPDTASWQAPLGRQGRVVHPVQ